MNSPRFTAKIAAASLAVSLGIPGATTANAALPPQIEQTSSQIREQVDNFRIELPPLAYELAERYNIALPEFLQPASSVIANKLDQANTALLIKQGNQVDPAAEGIAQEWANQGAQGQIRFESGAGDGLTHLDKGTGNVYKLNAEQAQQRLDWLSRNVNVNPGPQHRFGVATATDGQYIYLAEYFFHA